MNSLKQLVDRITQVERNGAINVVIPIVEARAIRDDMTKLLLEFARDNRTKDNTDVIRVDINPGRW